MPYISRYDDIYEQLEKINNNYKEDLKKSILQYAIQGKLVKQDSNDEPADILINKILNCIIIFILFFTLFICIFFVPTFGNSNTTNSISSEIIDFNPDGFVWPLPGYTRISSYFGKRKSPTTGASSSHSGIDIPAPQGTNFIAVSDGEITFRQFLGAGRLYYHSFFFKLQSFLLSL